MGFAGPRALARGLPCTTRKLHSQTEENDMKAETVILQTLFAACLLVCLLVLGAMLTSHATVASLAVSTAHAPVAAIMAG
jgi:hypothetical protein